MAQSNNTAATKSFVSINSFATSGRVVADAKVYESEKHGKCVRFSLAHNMGRDRDALFTDIVMFSKNGKKEVEIPLDLLKKGTAVVVEGYRRANNLRENGKIVRYGTDYVALSVVSIDSIRQTAEPTEDEQQA